MVVVVEGLMSMEEVVEEELMPLEEEVVEVHYCSQLDQLQQKVLKVSALSSFL